MKLNSAVKPTRLCMMVLLSAFLMACGDDDKGNANPPAVEPPTDHVPPQKRCAP